MGLLGIFSRFKKKKDTPEAAEVALPPLPQPAKTSQPETPVQQAVSDSDNVRLKIELLLSEMDGLRTQMEMINERLKIIERKLDQKGTIRYV